jgi:carbamoyl-phosphate synthase large subunit
VTPNGRRALVTVVGAVALVVGGFVLFESAMRRFEASAATALLHLAGAHNAQVFFGNSIQVYPTAHEPFRAVVTPSCSCIASLLALTALWLLSPRRDARRLAALPVALAVVTAGNILRIAASIAVGLVAGRASLVLFHDWVGTVFTFAYTLGGYVLMLYVLLPRRAGGDDVVAA